MNEFDYWEEPCGVDMASWDILSQPERDDLIVQIVMYNDLETAWLCCKVSYITDMTDAQRERLEPLALAHEMIRQANRARFL